MYDVVQTWEMRARPSQRLHIWSSCELVCVCVVLLFHEHPIHASIHSAFASPRPVTF